MALERILVILRERTRQPDYCLDRLEDSDPVAVEVESARVVDLTIGTRKDVESEDDS